MASMLKKCCCGCPFIITVTLAYDAVGHDVDLYVKSDQGRVCYSGRTSVDGLTLVQTTDEKVISGTQRGPCTIKIWWNQTTTTDPEGTPNIQVVNVKNTGTDSICVARVDSGIVGSGGSLSPGADADVANDLEDAGYGNGDQSGYSGGTEIVVTCGVCT